MNAQQPGGGDPFRCYVGRKVSLEDRLWVVECYELHGRRLLFRLRQIGSARARRVSMLELLELLEAQRL